jgi:very-short-patch-repair endonuclease
LIYWAEKKIGIETDGGIHNIPEIREYDESRSKTLEEKGIRVIRFTNEEVKDDIAGVLRKIFLFADSLPHPG